MQKRREPDGGEPSSAGVGAGHYAGGMGGGGPSVRPLTASALHSYLKRLEEKGFLSCKKTGKVNTYTAMVAREDYQRSEGESFLKKLYGSSISRFAAALYDGKRVEPAELEELQALLDRLSGGEET